MANERGPISVAVVKITDENRDALKWLALAQMLDGKKCVRCGFEFKSRQDAIDRQPVAASRGGDTIACSACWGAMQTKGTPND